MKKRIIVLVCCIAVLLITSSASAGSVEKPWTGPNICRNAKDTFLTFEDGGPAGSYPGTIPDQSGLHFSAAVPWTYWPTTELGTQGPFRAHGNMFASPTDSTDSSATEGEIHFPGGNASYASVLISTIAPQGVILEAYDAGGNKLDESGLSGPTYNFADRADYWMARLTVEDARGTIAYIKIRDTGSWWLVDDLCTDGGQGGNPPVSTPEFPSVILPVMLIAAFTATALYIRKSSKNQQLFEE
jgi:hypothetical protein